MKRLIAIFFILFIFSTNCVYAQYNFKEKKERRHVWRKWRKNNQSYNPYLDRKAKNKPSARIARSEKRELKHQKRMAKRQMRHSRKITHH